MQNLISISTGFLYKLTRDRNWMIDTIRAFSPEGIEISFARPGRLLDFKISDSNLKYLKGLKYVSIHAPWKDISYGDNQRSKDVISTIKRLYDLIGAKTVVFHQGNVEDSSFITNSGMVVLTENMGWNEKPNTIEESDNFLNENPDVKFVFDFAHALTVSPDEVPLYLDKFRDKLIEIHISYKDKEPKDHWFLHKHDSPKMRELLNKVKDFDVPLVLECVASNEEEISLIKKEMDYFKRI